MSITLERHAALSAFETPAADIGQQTWLTAEEAAAILRVHVTTVHDMCKRGDLPAMKAGRDWRIHAQGLVVRETLDLARSKTIDQTAERVAIKTAARILEGLAEALHREIAHQQFDQLVSS